MLLREVLGEYLGRRAVIEVQRGCCTPFVWYTAMAKKQSQRAKAANQLTTDLGRWDDEGRAPAVPSPIDVSDLPETERRILECLGAALVGVWHDLPTGIQRAIFQRATADNASDPAELSSGSRAFCMITRVHPTRRRRSRTHAPVSPAGRPTRARQFGNWRRQIERKFVE
jgi:hypothetical protein